ncbi:tetratricopeptide repeat protein [Taibaiella lutea]|uniref:Tetratricopeptide repeat protein n=1 Tax=Taibaiella lutea TaxID=2608001 RepID=A0A5M6CVF5_9BACT|nr:tetratricopeptide repeat protein [Taibaiella lutea]KAA5536965.1 tetratricopeptide repeat protein [Taibaiella lutea]
MKRVTKFLTGLFVLAILLVSNTQASAQKADSAAVAQKRITDSIAKANKQKADSLRFIRNYKESKHYKDSVEYARQARFADQAAERKRISDSITAKRKYIADSTMMARKRYSDSIKNYNDSVKLARARIMEEQRVLRQRRTDSLAAEKKYKESKRYKDSVEAVRAKRKADLVKVRKHYTDSVKTVQRNRSDSVLAARKVYNDSLKTALNAAKEIRTKQLDSLKAYRAARADSLSKVRQARAELRKQKSIEKSKEAEKKHNLALELKIKKKQAAYDNQKMRKKKWTVPRQIIQNTFTRYNYYFNANKKMEEAEDNMVRSHVNNYDSLIALFPFDPDVDSNKLKSDMDTIIRKAALGIQIHDPRAKWQDDLYLLLGQAYYYKGDYRNAGAAFKTIVSQAEEDKKEELKKKGNSKADKSKPSTFSDPEKTGIAGALEHKSAKNEALLWLARVLTQSGKEGQAQTVLDLLRNDANFPPRLNGKLALEQAFIDLYRDDYTKASQSLAIVAVDKEQPNWLRLRAAFLNAQIQQSQLNYAESNKYYNIALGLNSTLEMEFYAKKNIAVNNINNGSGTYTADNLLEKMSKDTKFKPYYDQIYFAMGKAALKNKQSDAALGYFEKSVQESKSNKKQKGLSFAALGDEYYVRSNYSSAKFAYDSAAMFLTPAEDPVYSIAQKRAQALDLVAYPGNVVKTQDSLLRMSYLTEKEQRRIIHDYVKDLEKRMRDSLYLAQNQPNNVIAPPPGMSGQKTVTWYFANPNLMRQGENDFKQKWGNRTLKDNWRISSSNVFVIDNTSDNANGEEEQNDLNLPNEDTLYAAIPHSQKEIDLANSQLSQGYFDLGKAYYTNLEDYEKAVGTFDTLDKRYPDHKNMAEEIYIRYIISMRQNSPTKAAAYNKELQQKFPDSDWGRLLSGQSQESESNPFPNVTNTNQQTISNFYDETYGLLMQRQYNEVLTRIKDADENYKNQGNFRKKFTLMKAVAIAGNGNYPEADTMLKQFISSNPNDSLVSWANTILAYMKQHPDLSNAPKIIPKDSTGSVNQASQSPDSTGNANALVYQYNPATEHYVIIAAPSSAKFSGLRSGLSDYNLMKASRESISVTVSTLDASRSLIVCKSFTNASEAKKYINEIKSVNVLFREFSPNEYDIMVISADNFPKLFIKKDYGVYKAFYLKNYRQ